MRAEQHSKIQTLIADRPAILISREGYVMPFPINLSANFGTVPEMIGASLASLGGVQPVTAPMAELTNGELRDEPSPQEVEYFKAKETQFQLIQVVLNLIYWETQEDMVYGLPYSISLLPSSKRGNVTHSTIEFVAKAGVPGMSKQSAYRGFNPFTGEWSIWSHIENFMGSGDVYFDEVGIVYDYFFLATDYDHRDVLDIGDPKWPWFERFNKKRNKQFFKPFEEVKPRRVWGVESPIELFLLQELISRNLVPQVQVMIMPDGTLLPSFYDALEAMPGGVEPSLTEADFFFPEQNIAVFCDGAHHRRSKQRTRDVNIDASLIDLGITPVRISGSDIMENLVAAGDAVADALSGQTATS